ncbi:allantoin permease [Alicyclobacillaceae bacterium I2511]|nr:allantoin permease [Alicyclobacillaceae bacterium I2511]
MDAGATPQVDAAFHLETEGTGVIARERRHGQPRELFFVWFAAVLTFTGVIMGQLFTSLGLNIWESLFAALLCSISFVALGWVAATGPKGGTVTLTISRAAFGTRGNRVPAFFSWLSAVGWESVTMVLTVWALLSLAQFVGLTAQGTVPTVLALLLTIALTYIVPIMGHATVITMQKWLAIALGVFGIILVIAVFPHVNWHFSPTAKEMAADGVFPTFLLALSVGLITTVYGWINFAADYSRYLPETTSARKIVGWTLLGGGIASMIVMTIGVLLGTYISSTAFSANPVMAIAKAVPAWAAIPFLLVVVIGDITANYLNAYSSGMSFLSMGVPMKRFWAVVLDGTLCTLIALYALFLSPGFVNFFENFLSLNILVIGPWAVIYLIYHHMAGGQYDAAGLMNNGPTGAYWYTNGINWRAMVAFIIGVVGTFWTVNSALWVSPLSKELFGGADLSAYMAPVITGLVYYWLTVKRQTAVKVAKMQ